MGQLDWRLQKHVFNFIALKVESTEFEFMKVLVYF